jgi:hypothetical protein
VEICSVTATAALAGGKTAVATNPPALTGASVTGAAPLVVATACDAMGCARCGSDTTVDELHATRATSASIQPKRTGENSEPDNTKRSPA